MGHFAWQLLGRITCITAWVACLGHLVFAWCIQKTNFSDADATADDETSQDHDEEAGATNAGSSNPGCLDSQPAGTENPVSESVPAADQLAEGAAVAER